MIHLFRSTPTGSELDAIKKVLDSGWWSMGPKVKEFEEAFAAYTGARYAVATNSCTAALDVAVRTIDLPDTVTITPLTFVSSALAAFNAGKKVRFVDVDEHARCTPKADIQVFYAGNDFGEGTIYDMAHYGGGKHRGLISCWSFHAVKNLPTGDGGMITTDDEKIYRRAKALSWCGIDKSTFERSKERYSWDYNITEPGLKANMNDIIAAIGLAQLPHLAERNEYRRMVAGWYDAHLKPEIRRPFTSTTWHMYTIQVPERDRLYDTLAENGIQAGVHYKPLYYYPFFNQGPLPVAERIFKETITLPLHTELTEGDVKKVCDVVNVHA